MENKEDILKKYVCKLPFTYTDVQTSAQFICCPSWNTQNIRADENGEDEDWSYPFDDTADVNRNWLSKSAYKIRKSMLDGTYHGCDRNVCPRLNQLINNGPSDSTSDIFIEIDAFKEIYNIHSEDDIKNFKTPPEEILFGFDTSCNLKCPSCRVNLIPNDRINSEKHKSKLHLLKSIEDNFASGLKKMLITGSGDPFYSKIYRDYLINFDSSKYPKLKEIQIITNGNLLDEKMWNSLKAAPYINTIEVSIDAGTKETYENNTRINGNWDRLISNLKFLSTIDTIEWFIVSMVVSKYNYKEMFTFYKLICDIFKNTKNKNTPIINYRQIVDWNTYSQDELKELQVFNAEHELYNYFIEELVKIKDLPGVDHNFHHLQTPKFI